MVFVSVTEVLLRDLVAGTTRVVSAPAGSYAAEPDVSAGGRFIAFVTPAPLLPGDPDGTVNLYLRDMTTVSPRRLGTSAADPSISFAGRRIGFTSGATDVVPGDTNGFDDVFASSVS